MHMFRHQHIPKQREIIPVASFVEDSQKNVSGALRAQKRPAAIATERDEMQIAAAIAAHQRIAQRFDSTRLKWLRAAHDFTQSSRVFQLQDGINTCEVIHRIHCGSQAGIGKARTPAPFARAEAVKKLIRQCFWGAVGWYKIYIEVRIIACRASN